MSQPARRSASRCRPAGFGWVARGYDALLRSYDALLRSYDALLRSYDALLRISPRRRALLLAPIVALAACGRGERSLEAVRERGYLGVGLDAAFPPFESIAADGDYEGLDVDLARLLATELGVEVHFSNIAFDGLYDALAAARVDAIISALPYEAQRTRDVRYSAPYFVDGIVLLRREGQPPLTELAGVVAVEMGSEAEALLRQEGDEVTPMPLLSEGEVIGAVAAGEAAAGLVGLLSACAARATGVAVTPGERRTRVPYCIATRDRDASLSRALADALVTVTAGDAWREARARWLGECL